MYFGIRATGGVEDKGMLASLYFIVLVLFGKYNLLFLRRISCGTILFKDMMIIKYFCIHISVFTVDTLGSDDVLHFGIRPTLCVKDKCTSFKFFVFSYYL